MCITRYGHAASFHVGKNVKPLLLPQANNVLQDNIRQEMKRPTGFCRQRTGFLKRRLPNWFHAIFGIAQRWKANWIASVTLCFYPFFHWPRTKDPIKERERRSSQGPLGQAQLSGFLFWVCASIHTKDDVCLSVARDSNAESRTANCAVGSFRNLNNECCHSYVQRILCIKVSIQVQRDTC